MRFTDRPISGNPALLLEFVKRWVQRSGTDLENVIRHLLESLGERPPMQRFELEDFEDQEVERALEEVDGFAHAVIGIRQQHIRKEELTTNRRQRPTSIGGLPGLGQVL